MAIMNLIKPVATIQESTPITEEITEISFDFDVNEAILERIDDDFVISFDADGSSIVLEDFYTIYDDEVFPDFYLDGVLIPGEEFFAAFDSTLMPAAGPAAAAAVAGSPGVYGTVNPLLAGGISALDGVDGASAYDVDPFLSDGVGGTPPSLIPDESDLLLEVEEEGVRDLLTLTSGPNEFYAGTTVVSGQLSIFNPDGGPVTYSLAPGFIGTGVYGDFSLAADGVYTYFLNNTVPYTQALY